LNRPTSVTEAHRIATPSGDSCAATLYLPERASGPLACVVMGAGGTLTQRDGIPDYAQRFAAAGLAALSFDYRHWGESDGEPRRRASVPRQLEDWRSAVAYARGLPEVDSRRIAVWGMSLGGGHALTTAADDSSIAAVVALVPMADGLLFSANLRVLRFLLRAVPERLRHGSATQPAVGPASPFPSGELRNFERLAGDNGWRNEVDTDLDYPLGLYRPVRKASRIRVPVLVQLGEHDGLAPRRGVERTASRARRGEMRRYPIDHFACFWPEHVDEVADDEIEFLGRHLGVGPLAPVSERAGGR
jgi:acetyl esterase/lipase